ncbi:MAG: YhjD/YihY/BrkB family envelope integrity protein [Acidimicrobiales bacterium]
MRLRRFGRWAFGAGKELAAEWSKDRGSGLAAEIAFFALLGFFPAVVALAAALGSAGAVLGDNAAAEIENWLVDQMIGVFGGDNSLEQTVRHLFSSTNGGAFTAGAALAVYAASRGFTAVVTALDIAYDHQQTRGWLSTRLVGLALTVLSVVVAAIALFLVVVGPLLGSGSDLADRVGVAEEFGAIWTWLRWPVVFVVMVGWAATVYHVAPSHRSPWRDELPGALLASVWWCVVTGGFSTYLSIASSGANAVFGFLGGAISLLFWLYLMAMGLLVGAEVNSIRATRSAAPTDNEPTAHSTRTVTDFRAPVDDILFNLRHVAGLGELAALPAFEPATDDLVEGLIGEAASSSKRSWRRSSHTGDTTGSVQAADGSVTARQVRGPRTGVTSTPDGEAVGLPVEYDGGGFPWAVRSR